MKPGLHLVERATCSVHGPIVQGNHETLTLAVEAHMKNHPPSDREVGPTKVTQWAEPVKD